MRGAKRSRRRSQATGAPRDEAASVVDTHQILIDQLRKYM
jgi:hypothetical protein